MLRDGILCCCALLASVLGGLYYNLSSAGSAPVGSQLAAEGVWDAAGEWIPQAGYTRIAALSTIASQVLPDLIPVQRLVAVSSWHQAHAHEAWRTAAIPAIASSADVEQILQLRPDLVIINNISMRPEVRARLRQEGLVVMDLGPMQGPPSLFANIRDLGQVLGVGERADALALALSRRLRAVAAHIPESQRQRAIILKVHGGHLIGGTRGSSYHQLLHWAGLKDAAAEETRPPWPTYSVEEVLRINPQVIVTNTSSLEQLRQIPGMSRFADRIYVLPDHFDTTGPEILIHAESLSAAVYGEVSGAADQ